MFLKFSFLLVLTTLTVQSSAGGCQFSGVVGELYTCDVSGVNYANENDPIDLSGIHGGSRKNENVIRIVFSNSKLVTVPARVFDTFVNMETVTARNVGMELINVGTLRDCSMLFNLYLDDNLITRLENGVFRNCRWINELTLANNRINFIGENVFNILLNLRLVSLQNNRITTMGPTWFSNMINIETILFDGNQISVYDPNTVRGAIGIRRFGLENNRITHIPAGAFLNRWFQKLALNGNRISSIGVGAFQGFGSRGRTRGVLDLHDNNLARLSSNIFNGSTVSLSQMSVANNRVTSIEPNFFTAFTENFSFLARDNVCVNGNIYLVTAETITGIEECFKNF